MYRDEVLEEVWRNRDSYAAEQHHNLAEIMADLRKHQGGPGVTVITRKFERRTEPAPNASSEPKRP